MSEDDDEGEEEGRINGHRPKGLLPLALSAALSASPAAADEFDFDIDEVLSAVVRLHSEIPADAYTAPILGTEREGHGIVIDDSGLVLTIGYLVMEAMAVSLQTTGGEPVPAEVVAYDYDSGFGLVRAMRPLNAEPMEIGTSADLAINEPVLVAGYGGRAQTIGALVVSKREFAGYWEYLLDEAIFTSPPHPNWGGAALIGKDGTLRGVGSLYVEDARAGSGTLPGNMFVPIDLLRPIFADLLTQGRASTRPRPWLGMFTAENEGRLEVVAVAPDGPAALSGIKPGDVVVKIGDGVVADMAGMYRLIWAIGPAGAKIPITLLRGNIALTLDVASEDRYQRLKLQRRY